MQLKIWKNCGCKLSSQTFECHWPQSKIFYGLATINGTNILFQAKKICHECQCLCHTTVPRILGCWNEMNSTNNCLAENSNKESLSRVIIHWIPMADATPTKSNNPWWAFYLNFSINVDRFTRHGCRIKGSCVQHHVCI